MGWFWADGLQSTLYAQSQPTAHLSLSSSGAVPSQPSCPMHKNQSSGDPTSRPDEGPSRCPIKHSGPNSPALLQTCPVPHESTANEQLAEPPSILSQLNPLNNMFRDLSQAPAPNQKHDLLTTREPSTIPKGDGQGNWEYPSPQQMYNALLRKGYHDTDVTAVESMVSVHNFLNEGAWAEIMEWEKRFSNGLYRGWQLCSQGEKNFGKMATKYGYEKEVEDLAPSLIRFQGRPKDMTPKATMIQVMGWIYPAMFATEPPFDRHDWFVTRENNGKRQEIRYVIDYYSGPPEANGEPVFYLDVRPALTPTAAAEQALRWGCDAWWKASGGEVRAAEKERSKSRSG